MPGASQTLSDSIYTTELQDFHSHFTDEKTKATEYIKSGVGIQRDLRSFEASLDSVSKKD